MKTRIFAHKGNLGVVTGDKFINDPTAPGQLGSVVDPKECVITTEAKELIKKSRRAGGSFAELMLDKNSIGVMGWGHIDFGDDFEIGRDCQLSVLDDLEVDENILPEEYKTHIDSKN